MVRITSGVNTTNLAVSGQSLATVKHQLKSALNLDGSETVRVNGNAPRSGYILRDNDRVEFIKAAGRKGAGSISVTCGVNSLTLDVAGQSVSTVRGQLKAALNIDDSYSIHVNGREANADTILRASDRVEFIKAAGRKGN
jgi:hypothetical protein